MHESVIAQFAVSGGLIRAERFGSGLINDTYLCEFDDRGSLRKYILQHINKTVFRHPDEVMENVEIVTEHVRGRLLKEGNNEPEAVTPALIRTNDGRSFHRNGTGEYWRMFHFIESGEVFDTILDENHAYEVGRGLGRFQALVSDLDPGKLHDTLPGFHYTPRYLAEYDEALRVDPRERAREIGRETDFIARRRGLAPLFTDLLEGRRLPIRVVHNDPKVNNIMIRRDTREALCMLDLDTVKPGIVHFDVGDCIRSCANPAGEDAEDLEAVTFALPLFEALTRGYLREAAGFLTREEIDLLPASVKVITFELGLRFLADYLRGDTYFKIKYPDHNLHRARVQFKLLESIEAMEKRMSLFIAEKSNNR